jgi:hypothetical protein
MPCLGCSAVRLRCTGATQKRCIITHGVGLSGGVEVFCVAAGSRSVCECVPAGVRDSQQQSREHGNREFLPSLGTLALSTCCIQEFRSEVLLIYRGPAAQKQRKLKAVI